MAEKQNTPNATRPILPADIVELRGVLIDEINRSSAALDPPYPLARSIAKTIVRDYEIPPDLREQFVQMGLADMVLGLLQESSENEDESEEEAP